MLNSIRTICICILFFFSRYYSQVSECTDTTLYDKSNSIIKLKHQFVIESSLVVYGQDKIIKPDKIDYINGLVNIPDSIASQQLFIRYNYLNYGLPISMGPKWKSLPLLDINSSEIDKIDHAKSYLINKKESSVLTSGSIHRKLNLSTIENPDFTGGLQMQINGKLSEDLSINGVLNDQDFPMQPEGTTQNLEELDNVYLSILHKNFSIDGGSIIYKNDNINRKLVGISSFYKNNDKYGSSVYASSKGNFKYLEIKGRDGDQGPYQLIGKDGNPDIIVISGTEKIWVNGKRLIRGHNYDYTIDYYNAEITFTPRILIDFDSDIMIEYQYSDYEYQQTFMGGNYIDKVGNLSIDLGLYRESDIYNKDENFDALSNIYNDYIKISTVSNDSKGDYVYGNNIYIYDPLNILSDTNRYQIVFQFDIEGDYVRKISDTGNIYYEYVLLENRGDYENLYSPYRKIYAPKEHNFGYLDYFYRINKNLNIIGNLSGSIINNNQLNSTILDKGGSFRLSANIDSVTFGPGYMNLEVKRWKRDDAFSSLGRENHILFTRMYNLDSNIENGIDEKLIQTDYQIEDFGKSNLEIAELQYQNNILSRVSIGHEMNGNIFSDSYFKYLVLNNRKKYFHRSELRLQTKLNKFTPYITFLSESEYASNHFWKTGIGLNITQNQSKMTTGIDYRMDDYINTEDQKRYVSRDIVGNFQFDRLSNNGIKENIILKKRIKVSDGLGNNYDYSLFDFNLKSNMSTNDLNWQIKLRKEETLIQQIAVVYDSIGLGKGQYRYDSTYNSYIPDQNGSYISYNIFTGNKIQNTNINGGQNISAKFSKLPFIANATLRYNARQEFQGDSPSLIRLFYPDINDKKIRKVNVFNRIETYFNKNGKVLLWIENSNELNGMDPRGNEQNRLNEIGLDITQFINKVSAIRNRLDINSFFIESMVSSLRDRNWSGWWNELQYQYKLGAHIEIDCGLLLGRDIGVSQNNEFTGNAYGIKLLNKMLYKDKGRFQCDMSFVNVIIDNENMVLPPESLNGHPNGMSIRTNWRIQYYLRNSLSMILSMNTIDDSRYKDFVSIEGEIRAHF